VKATWNDTVLAESNNTVLVEGNHYFPAESLDRDFFLPSSKTTVCGWKGLANYYDISVAGDINSAAAWYYAEPKSAAANIKGHVAFWRGVKVVA
jgi:uncharacterized protein (DUF427 family)